MNTPEEEAILSIVRLNKATQKHATQKQEVCREWCLGKWKVTYRRRFKNNLWGRFGGGWNWNLGFQIGSTTMIVNLLVASVSIRRIEVRS